jgi:hypothetical protein
VSVGDYQLKLEIGHLNASYGIGRSLFSIFSRNTSCKFLTKFTVVFPLYTVLQVVVGFFFFSFLQ